MSADEYRQFAREQQLRFEALVREWRRHSDRFFADLEAREERNERRFQKILAEVHETREENRAVLQALLRILDRLDGGGGAAPAT